MKKGLVLEGGAMRGVYTAGVLDVLMEKGIEADGVVGVSAGAVFGCNYISRQIGDWVRFIIFGHSKYWNLSDTTGFASYSARSLIHRSKVSIKITGIASSARHFFSCRRYFS